MRLWFDVLSDLFVNISAGWFAVVFIESNIESIDNRLDVFYLLLRIVSAIVALVIAKIFRQEAQQ